MCATIAAATDTTPTSSGRAEAIRSDSLIRRSAARYSPLLPRSLAMALPMPPRMCKARLRKSQASENRLDRDDLRVAPTPVANPATYVQLADPTRRFQDGPAK